MVENFHATPCSSATAEFGATFTFVDGTSGDMAVIPVVGVRITVGSCTNVATIADPAIVRSLIDDLSAALTALEASL